MTDLQIQARALGDPTRHDIFRFLVDADAPVGVGELTAHFAITHNAVRQHLAKLVDAGLVTESIAAPTGRGRPPLQYEVDPAADARWGTVGPYERLATLLAEVVRTGDSPIDVGRRYGSRLRPDAAGLDPVDALAAQMHRHGFEPEVRRRGARFEIVLDVCPFESAALTDPESVCALHLGIAEGFAASLDGLGVDDLETRDPRRAHCRLRGHIARSDDRLRS